MLKLHDLHYHATPGDPTIPSILRLFGLPKDSTTDPLLRGLLLLGFEQHHAPDVCDHCKAGDDGGYRAGPDTPEPAAGDVAGVAADLLGAGALAISPGRLALWSLTTVAYAAWVAEQVAQREAFESSLQGGVN